jgi:hypothetical protein
VIVTFNKKDLNKYLILIYMASVGDKNKPNSAFKFHCEKCDYGTSKKSNYDTHLTSDKHKRITNELPMGQKEDKNKPNIIETFICSCGKQYQHRQGLWKHKKKCNNNNNISDTSSDTNYDTKETEAKELIQYLMKENSEFKQLMIDQNKQMLTSMQEQNKNMLELAKNSGNHNSHNTTNNNSFNLNVFLNETCKDAMNIMEFVDQLQVSVKDLEETGRLGYAEGISKIFINGLKQINISDRPIHCADSKREIVYIKDKNQWNKEDDNKSLLTNAIKHVAHKNMKQIREWTKVNPEYNDSSSKQNDRYLKIVSNSMNGLTEEEASKNYSKIIKNITKETVIDK